MIAVRVHFLWILAFSVLIVNSTKNRERGAREGGLSCSDVEELEAHETSLQDVQFLQRGYHVLEQRGATSAMGFVQRKREWNSNGVHRDKENRQNPQEQQQQQREAQQQQKEQQQQQRREQEQQQERQQHMPDVGAGSALAFTHIPANFGQSVEVAGLQLDRSDASAWAKISSSFDEPSAPKAEAMLHEVLPSDSELWGMMDPRLRGFSDKTKCHLYYTPPTLQPKDVAERYYRGKTAFAFLRDPYDRLVNDFRRQVFAVENIFAKTCRQNTSAREGHMERESEQYKTWYRTCDVNAYLKAELAKVVAGDRFRADCHFLPQAEFFNNPYAKTTLALDTRKIPSVFDELMIEHGNSNVKMSGTLHNLVCNNLSAYSLEPDVRTLIKQVYADDFALLCVHFGHCSKDEMTCISQIPHMCGGKPGTNLTEVPAPAASDTVPVDGLPKFPCGHPGDA
eukprot:TRINITY_DN15444_c0_g1_i1.p1 TRINITY_DN15444_c0_g1~~TRINITY_DN15444_c0_g1_i1.p1  ORF type:complete len:453 (-),score=89.59 TRINITY_DN15444_c0_g1_i1:761-2119(-)